MANTFALLFLFFAGGPALNAQQLAGPSTSYSEAPEEVLIKGENDDRLKTARPPLTVKADSFEILRPSLGADKALFLFESGDFSGQPRSYPDRLFSTEMVQPWRAGFNDKTVIAFYPLKKFEAAFGKDYAEKTGKESHWALSITDEEGKLFYKYSGTGLPPENINWTGENDRHEWLSAGRSYAPVYVFTDAKGLSKTIMDEVVKFTALVYQKPGTLIISLDSVSLFGPDKSSRTIGKPQGEDLLSATADLIKRRFYGLPIKVSAYARTADLAGIQSGLIQNFLKDELMMAGENIISGEGLEDSFTRQRVDIALAGK